MDELQFPRQEPRGPLSSGQDDGFHRPHQLEYRRDSNDNIQYDQHGEEEQEYEQQSDERMYYQQNNNRNTSVISDPGSQEAPRAVTPQRRMPIQITSHLARRAGERGQQRNTSSLTKQSEHSRDDMSQVLYSPSRQYQIQYALIRMVILFRFGCRAFPLRHSK